MRIEAPCLSSLTSDNEEELSDKDVKLDRKMQSWMSAHKLEVAETDQLIAQLTSDLSLQRKLVLEANLSVKAFSEELRKSKDEILILRGKLRFLEARSNGLEADLKVRQSLNAVSEARLLQQISDLCREVKVLRSLRQTESRTSFRTS